MRLWMWVLCLVFVLTAQQTAAQESSSVVITGAWVRATAAASETGAGGVSGTYMTIANESERGLALLAASTGAAGLTEIHEVQMDDGIMRMQPIERIELAPGEHAVLEPGGLHIMLLDLTRPLAPGDAISLTLTFAPLQPDRLTGGAAFEVVIGVPVLDSAPPATNILVTDAWARPTVTDIVGLGMAEAPRADRGVVSPETHSHAGEAGETASGDLGVSAVYFRVVNLGEAARLISAATDAAGLVEIHETQMADGVMRMQPVAGIDLLTEQPVFFEPGGLHIMMLDLTRPLVTGEALALTLTFESGELVTIGVPIYDRLMMP